jgi:hypothetical protein
VINPRFIGISAGAWLGLAWAIGIGKALVVLALAVAGYVVARLVTRQGREETDGMSWRWPRRKEARTEARRRREARREASVRLEQAPLGAERMSVDGRAGRNGVGQAAS